jgi:hypothetical protein
MKAIPKDDAALDAMFGVISGDNSLAAHISNASLPNEAEAHNSAEWLLALTPMSISTWTRWLTQPGVFVLTIKASVKSS